MLLGPPGLPSRHEGIRVLFEEIGEVEQAWTIEDVIAENDKVVVRATNTCMQETFFGVPGTGITQVFSATFILQFADGLVRNTWRNAADLQRLFQLEVIAAGTPAITRTDFHYGAHVCERFEIRPDSYAAALYAPRRYVLDTLLADAAARAGATVKRGARVVDVLKNEDHVASGVRWTESGRVFSADATLIIGADGRTSTIAHLVGAQKDHADSSAGGVLLAYWSGLERHAYQWFYDLGGTVGVIPTNGGQACVWVGMPASLFRAGPSSDAVYAQLLGRFAPTLDLSGGRQHGPIRGYPGAPGFVRRSSGPGWALVGDAGYFKDPITAHGITDALRDAELLARAVISAPHPGPQQAKQLRDYQNTRDALSSQLRVITDRIATYEWDLDEIQKPLPELGRAMRPEVATIQKFDENLDHPGGETAAA